MYLAVYVLVTSHDPMDDQDTRRLTMISVQELKYSKREVLRGTLGNRNSVISLRLRNVAETII